jgi:phage gp36-like protein
MFVHPDELKTAIYEYQLNEITENDHDIVLMAIGAAVEEMKSYLNPNNQTRWRDGRAHYDTEAIFTATGSDRNPLVLELCKNMTVYYITRLSNWDLIHKNLKDRYDRAIDWLEKVAGIGKYANAPALTPDLPVLPLPEEGARLPFRHGGREKFNHE